MQTGWDYHCSQQYNIFPIFKNQNNYKSDILCIVQIIQTEFIFTSMFPSSSIQI